MPQTTVPNRSKKTGRAKSVQSGQAVVLIAVIIALLFAVFTLVYEVGRLLIAREVAISASQRAGEAALSYLVDYAQRRSDWNERVLHAQKNLQVWNAFYDENTGIPNWLREQAVHYAKKNLADHANLVTQTSIDALTVKSVEFPYKDSNWPTAAIGVRMTLTIEVPLVFFGQLGSPTLPITVQTISITTVDELLNAPSGGQATLGQGGSITEFNGVPRALLNNGAPVKWVEPFNHFADSAASLINQWWGCPKDPVSAYSYAGGRHAGMDFGVPEGTNLFAVANATVYNTGFYPNQIKPIGNNAVILKTDDGSYFVTYMHMLSINVTQGQHVNAGDLIGVSDGDPSKHKDNPSFTGFSGGAHLHFQVAQGKFYDYPYDLDPESFLGLGADHEHAKAPEGVNGQCFAAAPAATAK